MPEEPQLAPTEPQQLPPQEVTPPESEPTPEEYFLTVDERHRYRTADDAAEAFRQAGERIGELTPLAEIVGRYGIQDPYALQRVLDDYVAIQAERERSVRQPVPQPQAPVPEPTRLGAEDENIVKYLEGLGYTRREAVDKLFAEKLNPLMERLNALEAGYGSSLEASLAARQSATIESSRSYLASLMTDSQLPIDNVNLNANAETYIIGKLEAESLDPSGREFPGSYERYGDARIIPGSPLARVYDGGEQAKRVIKQAYDEWIGSVNVLRQHVEGQYQKSKQQATARTPKVPPREGAPILSDQTDEPKKPLAPGVGSLGIRPELHNKAWEILQRAEKERTR